MSGNLSESESGESQYQRQTLSVVNGAQPERFAYEVVHHVAGRLRVRIDDLRAKPGFAERFVNALMGEDGVSANGITGVRVNKWCASAVITYDENMLSLNEACLRLDLADIGRAPETAKASKSKPAWIHSVLKAIERFAPAAVQLGCGVGAFMAALSEAPVLLTGVLLFGSTAPIMGRALRTAVDERRLGVDGLDGMAALLMVAQGHYVAAGFMTTLIGLGEFIRDCTEQKCKAMIVDLLGLAGRSAWVVRGKKRICLPADQVKVGDVVVVYPGDLVPVDGTVISGHAAVDQSKLTGESMPVELGPGDNAFAATVVVEGKIYLRCEAAGADTRAQMVVDLVNEAPLHETKIQNYASLLADRAVMPVLWTALGCFLITRNVTRAMSILIFDFATGIRISAPTAILSSMERSARRGILVKSGGALERLSKVDAVIFDKTGTLTQGEAHITEVVVFNGLPADHIIRYAASAEQRLHHPAALAIVRHAVKLGLAVPERTKSDYVNGMGMMAEIDGHAVLVGSRKLMEAEKVEMSAAGGQSERVRARGDSLSYVAVDGKLEAIIAYNDRLRPEVKQVISRLRKLGIKEIIMATGDGEAPAQAVADECGIEKVISRAFPEHKAQLVQELKARGMTVAMVGDGINDSPALVHGDVAVSLHGGTDVARERSDVVLTDDDLTRLPEAIEIARAAMSLVKQNFGLVAVPNGVGLGLAGFGLIGPATATLLNNGSAIVAAVNALRPLYLNNLPPVDAELLKAD